MIKPTKSLLLALALTGATVGWATAASAAPNCTLQNIKSVTPDGHEIDTVKAVATPLAHCEVVGHTTTTEPFGTNQVNWMVLLPDEGFMGRYYFIGQGAAAGSVPTTTSTEGGLNTYYAGAAVQKMAEGFAVSSSDTGHKGMMWDFAIEDKAAKYNHGSRGAHLAAVASQAITKGYYDMGKQKLYRYHLGCSGGGRMGAMAALHHPEDYDGIVASTGFMEGNAIWFAKIVQYLVRDPDRWIPPAKLEAMERKVKALCADPDGLIRDANTCGFDPASMKCTGKDNAQCLTSKQIDMARVITGRTRVTPDITVAGFTYTNPIGWGPFLLGVNKPTGKDATNPWAPNPVPSAFGIVNSILRGMYFDTHDFNFITDLDFNNEEHLKVLEAHHADWGAGRADLTSYKKAGGKFILWAPLGENAVPPGTETEYYDWLKKKVPGTDNFLRVYEVPGVWHCAGGPGPQDSPERFLDAVIDWAEQGKRPDELVVNGAAAARGLPQAMPSPTRSVLVCPYPQKAIFAAKKGAFPYDARNWKCK